MKIIVSTKYFKNIIESAIKKGSQHFVIKRDPDSDIYGHLFIYYGNGHISEQISIFEGDTFKGLFNIGIWNKLSEFISLLPDQPITIEFKEYNDKGELHTNPEISIPHCTMKFYK